MLLLFSTAVFLSASLLFSLEPMFGRMVLPLLGGSPAVWNTVMVFYQAALLAGYGYAHALSRGGLRFRLVHLALMAAGLLVLPVRLASHQTPPPSANPVLWLLLVMSLTVGLPFLLVSTTGPLLQRWFAHTRHARARDPYFLYAASNVGSMIGLIAYPFVLEPRWTLLEQSRGWTLGYAVLWMLVMACALLPRRAAPAVEHRAAPEPPSGADDGVGWRRRLHWVALAFVPSSLMLGVTTHLSMELVAMPLLWIIPLAIYLATFILAFANRRILSEGLVSRLLVFTVLGILIVLESRATEPFLMIIGLHLGALFAAAAACHGRLASQRPGVRHLTEYYLWIAAGGALGGLFNAVLAPMWFKSVAEYPLALVLACLLAPGWGGRSATGAPSIAARLKNDLIAAAVIAAIVAAIIFGIQFAGHTWRRAEFVIVLALLCFPLYAFRKSPARFGLALGGVMLLAPLAVESGQHTIHAERSFFGIHRVLVERTPAGAMRQLTHGTTLHGVQWIEPERCNEPLGYYHRLGPAGQVFAVLGRSPRTITVGVAGLGNGSLSAYAQAGQRWTYFEIDPAVVRIATNPEWFCYLAHAAAPQRILLGDARLTLAADSSRYDLLVLDAYTSDAIPVHLLTREAFRLYLTHLEPGGVLVLHLSNRYFKLRPVVAALARDAGLACRIRSDPMSDQDLAQAWFASDWAVVARDEKDLGALVGDPRWKKPIHPSNTVWTDDFSSLVSVLR